MTDAGRDTQSPANAPAAAIASQASETKTDDTASAVTETPSNDLPVSDFPPEPYPHNVTGHLRAGKVLGVVLAVLLLISAGATAWLYFNRYQADQQVNGGVAEAVLRAASDGTVALLSYSADSLDKDFAAAKSHLAGDFLAYYNQFTEQVVAPAAKRKSLKATARVVGAGVSQLHPNSAQVLVFADQSTTSNDKPTPTVAASSALVNLTRVNTQWLITKFDPV